MPGRLCEVYVYSVDVLSWPPVYYRGRHRRYGIASVFGSLALFLSSLVVRIVPRDVLFRVSFSFILLTLWQSTDSLRAYFAPENKSQTTIKTGLRLFFLVPSADRSLLIVLFIYFLEYFKRGAQWARGKKVDWQPVLEKQNGEKRGKQKIADAPGHFSFRTSLLLAK